MPYSKRLDVLNLTTLEKRRLRGDLIEVYKLLTGRENIDHTAFSSWMTVVMVREDKTGHKYKLKKYRSRLDIRKHFFSNRVVSHWNSLPSMLLSMLIQPGRPRSASMSATSGAFKVDEAS